MDDGAELQTGVGGHGSGRLEAPPAVLRHFFVRPLGAGSGLRPKKREAEGTLFVSLYVMMTKRRRPQVPSVPRLVRASARGRPPKYCSAACRQRAYQRRQSHTGGAQRRLLADIGQGLA